MITTVNSLPLLRADVVLPRVGVWTADLEVDTETPITGRVTVTLGALALVGTVLYGGITPGGAWSGRVVGGAGGLARSIGATAHRNASLGEVLRTALTEAGETLSPTAIDLSAPVARWARLAGPAARTVEQVAAVVGASWRVLADGSVWIGPETWADQTAADALTEHVDVVTSSRALAGDSAAEILPGRTLRLEGLALRVGAVSHRLDAERFRTHVWVEDRPYDRLLGAFRALVEAITGRHTLRGLFPARVVLQRADGSVDVVPDDPRVPAPQAVSIRHGLPGVTGVAVAVGTRVRLGFEGGDPSLPFAALWDAGNATSITFNASSHQLARTTDTTSNGKLVFSPTGTFVAYVPPGAPDVPTPPGGSAATLSGVITGTSVIRG